MSWGRGRSGLNSVLEELRGEEGRVGEKELISERKMHVMVEILGGLDKVL